MSYDDRPTLGPRRLRPGQGRQEPRGHQPTTLTAFAELYAQSDELSTVLENPLVLDDAREGIVTEVATKMGLGDTAKGTLASSPASAGLVMCGDLAGQLARLADVDDNVLPAPRSPASARSARLTSAASRPSSRSRPARRSCSAKPNPSLIGGVVTRIGDA